MAEGSGEEKAGTNRPTIFVSHASQDAAVANAVVEILERTGLARWIAPRDVVPGSLYADEIVRAINKSSFVVLVLSAQSVASPHVGKELERASSKRRRIIALRMDSTPLPGAFEYFLSESQWIDTGTGGIELAAAKLAEAVRHHLGSSLELSADDSRTVAVARNTTITTDSPTERVPSIAVLPFANMSGDKEQEYFSDGLAEEIINALAQIAGLKVIARTSAFAFKGQNTDIRRIAETLGVANILEGSVRRSGNRIRVTAQLITASDGTHLWSERFDRELADVFAVQDEISAAISEALKVRLSPKAAARTTGMPLPDVFLSYSHDDEATARRFAEALEREGCGVWWDTSLRSGEAFEVISTSTSTGDLVSGKSATKDPRYLPVVAAELNALFSTRRSGPLTTTASALPLTAASRISSSAGSRSCGRHRKSSATGSAAPWLARSAPLGFDGCAARALCRRPARRRGRRPLEYQVCGLLADHDGCRVGVSRSDARHD